MRLLVGSFVCIDGDDGDGNGDDDNDNDIRELHPYSIPKPRTSW